MRAGERIPRGRVGAYLNVYRPDLPASAHGGKSLRKNPHVGITGATFEHQGLASRHRYACNTPNGKISDPSAATYCSPGGQMGGPHYDIRGWGGFSHGNPGKTGHYLRLNTIGTGDSTNISGRGVALKWLKTNGLEDVAGFIEDVLKRVRNTESPAQIPGQNSATWPPFPDLAKDKHVSSQIPNLNQILGLEEWSDSPSSSGAVS